MDVLFCKSGVYPRKSGMYFLFLFLFLMSFRIVEFWVLRPGRWMVSWMARFPTIDDGSLMLIPSGCG